MPVLSATSYLRQKLQFQTDETSLTQALKLVSVTLPAVGFICEDDFFHKNHGMSALAVPLHK